MTVVSTQTSAASHIAAQPQDPALTASIAIALIAAATIAGAWFFQLALDIVPCPMCLEQRWAYYADMVQTLAWLDGKLYAGSTGETAYVIALDPTRKLGSTMLIGPGCASGNPGVACTSAIRSDRIWRIRSSSALSPGRRES